MIQDKLNATDPMMCIIKHLLKGRGGRGGTCKIGLAICRAHRQVGGWIRDTLDGFGKKNLLSSGPPVISNGNQKLSYMSV